MEKFKVYLGLVLTLVIISAGIFLLWQKDLLNNLKDKNQNKIEATISNYKKENDDLRQKIIELQEENKKLAESSSQVCGDSDNVGDKININTASAEELDTLSGIGPSRAQAIISYREKYNGFKSIEEIKNIKGIGDAIFEQIKDMITVD